MGAAVQRPDVDTGPRAATEEEVQHFIDFGWTKMERFISPELAGRLLEVAKREITENERAENRLTFRSLYFLGRDDKVEPFASLNRSEVIGRNAQRFIQRDVPIAMHADLLAVKMSSEHESSSVTGFHQDWTSLPLDRTGVLAFWIALEDLTPEQGVMRFYSGSHKEGPLGDRRHKDINRQRGLLDEYPYIEKKYPLSPPLHMKAGDCTVHNSLVIHGAPGNTTTRPRWSYIMVYYPGDAKWTGVHHYIFNAEAGLKVGEPVRSPRFPIVTP